jgi:hypothetical protein
MKRKLLQNDKECVNMKNKQENEVRATIWKVFSNAEGNHYHLQIEGIRGKRVRKKVLSAVDGWREVGRGSNRDQEETLLMSRKFKEPSSWLTWASQFPFELQELNRNGKLKNIKRKEG